MDIGRPLPPSKVSDFIPGEELLLLLHLRPEGMIHSLRLLDPFLNDKARGREPQGGRAFPDLSARSLARSLACHLTVAVERGGGAAGNIDATLTTMLTSREAEHRKNQETPSEGDSIDPL